MSEVFWVDFHTHDSAVPDAAVPDAVIRIISTPLDKVDRITTHPGIRRTLELHPWQGEKFSDMFAQTAADDNFIGIGEVGLDRLRGKLPLAEQIEVLTAAIELAEQLQKPLTIHCVKCFSELLALRKKLRWQVPTVIHYFRGNLKLAQQLFSQSDFILSLPPGTADEVWDFLRTDKQYLRRIVLETDTPDGDIKKHYFHAAEKLALPAEDLQKSMFEQYLRIYHG